MRLSTKQVTALRFFMVNPYSTKQHIWQITVDSLVRHNLLRKVEKTYVLTKAGLDVALRYGHAK